MMLYLKEVVLLLFRHIQWSVELWISSFQYYGPATQQICQLVALFIYVSVRNAADAAALLVRAGENTALPWQLQYLPSTPGEALLKGAADVVKVSKHFQRLNMFDCSSLRALESQLILHTRTRCFSHTSGGGQFYLGKHWLTDRRLLWSRSVPSLLFWLWELISQMM